MCDIKKYELACTHLELMDLIYSLARTETLICLSSQEDNLFIKPVTRSEETLR